MIVRSFLTEKRLQLLELTAALAVFALAVAVRVVRLGDVPRVVSGDEADNLSVAYLIIEGNGPGFFGFDWKPAPIFSLYPLAWTVQLFGSGVSDFRLFAVLTSLLVIIAFYLVARRAMDAPAALLAMALLSTNLWFLNFSRTAWENTNAALFALAACYATTRALESKHRNWWMWWILSGFFVAGGLYGYFTGRFIFLAVGIIAVVAVASRLAPLKRSAAGLAMAALTAMILFAPMASTIAHDWDRFNSRTNNVSVFAETNTTEETGWPVIRQNITRNFEGLILQEGRHQYGELWKRYTPPGRPPLDTAGTILFLAGLVVSVAHWRKTYAWWAFFVPLAIAEVFSRGTPDLARAILFAPFYFLFIGIALDGTFSSLQRWPLVRLAAMIAATVVISTSAYRNVSDYANWQADGETQAGRMPGVDVCEFERWLTIAQSAARDGVAIDRAAFAAARIELGCSEAYLRWRQTQRDDPSVPVITPTPIIIPTATPRLN